MTTTLAPAPDRPDVDDVRDRVPHVQCAICWPDHETEPRPALCGEILPPGPLMDPVEAREVAGACVVCVDMVIRRYGPCPHNPDGSVDPTHPAETG